MSIIDLFSKRQKRLRGEVPDVFTYDHIPEPLKVQILQILDDTLALGQDDRIYPQPRHAGRFLVEGLRKEYGVFSLTGNPNDQYRTELFNFILTQKATDRVIDAIELSFRVVDNVTRHYNYRGRQNASSEADDAIAELNSRFQEHGVGYRFESGEVIRIDSEFVHAEVVKPALVLLASPTYAGPQAEFLSAHAHYRHGRSKEALTDCLKALESTMKVIAAKRKWPYDPNKATANVLVALMFDKQLVPAYWSSHFGGLRSMLEAGVPTVRNRTSGHGQGAQVVDVPQHVVAFGLHQTAAAIVFLASAEKELL